MMQTVDQAVGVKIRAPTTFKNFDSIPAVGEDAIQPFISRKGNRLTYLRRRRNINIWRTEGPNGTGPKGSPTQLISSTRDQMDQDISHNGLKIAFRSNRTGSFEIWTCDSDGKSSALGRVAISNGLVISQLAV